MDDKKCESLLSLHELDTLKPLYALGFRSEGLNGDKISDFAIEP